MKELTTYQIYLMLLGYLTKHENTLEPLLTELYKRAENAFNTGFYKGFNKGLNVYLETSNIIESEE